MKRHLLYCSYKEKITAGSDLEFWACVLAHRKDHFREENRELIEKAVSYIDSGCKIAVLSIGSVPYAIEP